MKKISLLLLLTLPIGVTHAATCPASKLIFSCTIYNNNKVAELCDFGKNVKYTFGRKNNPELVLTIPADKVVRSHQGNRYVVNLSNNGVTYSVYSDMQTTPTGTLFNNGIEVFTPKSGITDIRCNPKYTLIDKISNY